LAELTEYEKQSLRLLAVIAEGIGYMVAKPLPLSDAMPKFQENANNYLARVASTVIEAHRFSNSSVDTPENSNGP
jgi:hypothetical protein